MQTFNITCLAFLSVVTAYTAVRNPALNEQTCFRDAHFGADFHSFPDLKDLKSDSTGSNGQWYVRESDSLKIGRFKVKNIRYGFYKNKLCIVGILVEGVENSKGLLDEFKKQYGEPTSKPSSPDVYYWYGDNVLLEYIRYPMKDGAIATFTSNVIAEQIENDQKNKH